MGIGIYPLGIGVYPLVIGLYPLGIGVYLLGIGWSLAQGPAKQRFEQLGLGPWPRPSGGSLGPGP